MTVEIVGGKGFQTLSEADDLDQFEFERGHEVVRIDPLGNRGNGNIWTVNKRWWAYRVSWICDRDEIPTREHHRRYTLFERESWEETELSEADLKRGLWRPLAEVEQW